MIDEEQAVDAQAAADRTFFRQTVESQQQAIETIREAARAADAEAVYSAPVEQHGYTVITASELSVGLGLGFGMGGSVGSAEGDGEKRPDGSGAGGGGGGGGGWSLGRPVAAIIIGPEGVRVEPIFDMTKVGIAAVTALGALFLGWRAMISGK